MGYLLTEKHLSPAISRSLMIVVVVVVVVLGLTAL